jgi:hypothetical protein
MNTHRDLTVHELMKPTSLCFLFFLAMFPAGAPAQSKAASRLHLADYDAELRRANGRVDTPAMIQRLKELGITTYY